MSGSMVPDNICSKWLISERRPLVLWRPIVIVKGEAGVCGWVGEHSHRGRGDGGDGGESSGGKD